MILHKTKKNKKKFHQKITDNVAILTNYAKNIDICDDMHKIILPNSVYTFDNCYEELCNDKLVIPNSIKYIKSNGYLNRKNYKSVKKNMFYPYETYRNMKKGDGRYTLNTIFMHGYTATPIVKNIFLLTNSITIYFDNFNNFKCIFRANTFIKITIYNIFNGIINLYKLKIIKKIIIYDIDCLKNIDALKTAFYVEITVSRRHKILNYNSLTNVHTFILEKYGTSKNICKTVMDVFYNKNYC